jgi:hypothetical protein
MQVFGVLLFTCVLAQRSILIWFGDVGDLERPANPIWSNFAHFGNSHDCAVCFATWNSVFHFLPKSHTELTLALINSHELAPVRRFLEKELQKNLWDTKGNPKNKALLRAGVHPSVSFHPIILIPKLWVGRHVFPQYI